MLTRPALAGLVAAAALLVPAAPAQAGPCDGVTLAYCLKPVIVQTGDRLQEVRDDVCDLVAEPC